MGLLTYATAVLRFPLCTVYHAMKHYCIRGRQLALDEADWDGPADVPPSVLNILERWTNTLIENTPVHPRERNVPFKHIIVTDASGSGFAYVHYCVELNSVKIYA